MTIINVTLRDADPNLDQQNTQKKKGIGQAVREQLKDYEIVRRGQISLIQAIDLSSTRHPGHIIWRDTHIQIVCILRQTEVSLALQLEQS